MGTDQAAVSRCGSQRAKCLGVLASSEASLKLAWGLEDGAGWWPSPVPAGCDHTALEERARPPQVLGRDASLAPGHARVREASLLSSVVSIHRVPARVGRAGPCDAYLCPLGQGGFSSWSWSFRLRGPGTLNFKSGRWAPQDGSLQPWWWRRLTSAPPCPLPYVTDPSPQLPGVLRASQGSPLPLAPTPQPLALCGKDWISVTSVLVAN